MTHRWRSLVVAIALIGVTSCSTSDETATAPTVESNEGEVVRVQGSPDRFRRPDDATTLGSIPDGPVWFSETGTWGVSGGEAYLSDPVDGRSQAVVDLGQGDGSVEVRLTKLTNGAGLVFRYRDPQNFWAVVAVPGYATWAVVKVVGGVEEIVGNTGLSAIDDGTIVGVRMDGATLDVLLEQQVVRTFHDDELAEADKVGLTAQALPGIDPRQARFDDFRVALAGGDRLPAAGPGGGAAG